MNDGINSLTSLTFIDTDVVNSPVFVKRYLGLYANNVMCLCFCLHEQESVSVAAAEAAPVPEAASNTAPDTEPDQPKEIEMEETVSHH